MLGTDDLSWWPDSSYVCVSFTTEPDDIGSTVSVYGDDAFTVFNLKIDRPNSDWHNNAPFRFDNQGVASDQPESYTLDISGTAHPLSCYWTIEGGGTFGNGQTVSTVASPGHQPPAGESEGLITLKARRDAQILPFMDQKDIVIFARHLDRDIENEAALDEHVPYANCYNASYHGFDGTLGEGGCPYGGSPIRIYDTGDSEKDTVDEIDFSGASRGVVIIYGGDVDHTETFTDEQSDATWGANTPCDPHWGMSNVLDYIENHPKEGGGPGHAACRWIDLYPR